MMAFAGTGVAQGFGLRIAPARLPESRVMPEPERPGFSADPHINTVRARIERWFARQDLVPDLAEDIGSARWFRGFGTMLGLGAAAFMFWPTFAPLQAAPLTLLSRS